MILFCRICRINYDVATWTFATELHMAQPLDNQSHLFSHVRLLEAINSAGCRIINSQISLQGCA